MREIKKERERRRDRQTAINGGTEWVDSKIEKDRDRDRVGDRHTDRHRGGNGGRDRYNREERKREKYILII